jgi:hypothetical protein
VTVGVEVGANGGSAGVSTVAAGTHETCALVTASIECWGNNDAGQLGDNSTTNSLSPVDVSGIGE